MYYISVFCGTSRLFEKALKLNGVITDNNFNMLFV